MQQEAAERYKGRELVGQHVWQYRFDPHTVMAAGGAKQEAGTWHEALVVDYDDQTGQHEVRTAQKLMVVDHKQHDWGGACWQQP